MAFLDIFSSYTSDIASVFIAFLVSYFIVQKINDNDEFLEDNARRIKYLKVFWGTISFLGTFFILAFVLSSFDV